MEARVSGTNHRFNLLLVVFGLGALAARLQAASHGPAFGLATPTLGKGQWSSDTVGMALGTDEGTSYMTREWVGYGITPDLQATLAFPLSQTIDKLASPPRTRFGSMMGAYGDVEGSLLWRFQRRATGVDSRFGSTLMLGGSVPTEDKRGGGGVGTSVNVVAVTGYASRSVYAWLGGGYQRYVERAGDRLGDQPYLSAVVGYRPPMFLHDLPKPDWRIFMESLAEFPHRDQVGGVDRVDTDGEKVLIGPSLLGLYGKWGVEAGVLFPVYQRLNGNQPEETYRATLDFTWCTKRKERYDEENDESLTCASDGGGGYAAGDRRGGARVVTLELVEDGGQFRVARAGGRPGDGGRGQPARFGRQSVRPRRRLAPRRTPRQNRHRPVGRLPRLLRAPSSLLLWFSRDHLACTCRQLQQPIRLGKFHCPPQSLQWLRC